MTARPYKVVVVGTRQARACTTPPPSRRTPASSWSGLRRPRRPPSWPRPPPSWAVRETSTDPARPGREVQAGRLLLLHAAQRPARADPDRASTRGRKLIAYEKPIALSMNEAHRDPRRSCRAAGVKTVVSHQHRYGEHYRKVQRDHRRAARSAGCTRSTRTRSGWMMHMITHLVDLMRWYNGNAEAEWVMAQAAGPRQAGRQPPLARLHRRASSSSPTACAATSSAAPARPTCPRWTTGGARTASARRAPTGSPRRSPAAAGGRSRQTGRAVGRGLHELRPRHAALRRRDGRLARRRRARSTRATARAPTRGSRSRWACSARSSSAARSRCRSAPASRSSKPLRGSFRTPGAAVFEENRKEYLP